VISKKRQRTPRILADDPKLHQGVWALSFVLLEIAKNDLDRDGADMPGMEQQSGVKPTKSHQISGFP